MFQSVLLYFLLALCSTLSASQSSIVPIKSSLAPRYNATVNSSADIVLNFTRIKPSVLDTAKISQTSTEPYPESPIYSRVPAPNLSPSSSWAPQRLDTIQTSKNGSLHSAELSHSSSCPTLDQPSLYQCLIRSEKWIVGIDTIVGLISGIVHILLTAVNVLVTYTTRRRKMCHKGEDDILDHDPSCLGKNSSQYCWISTNC